MVIYKITNKVNGKIYIGQTRRDLDTRIRGHINSANCGSLLYFHCAIRKYGWENFDAVVIDTANSIDELNRLERYYIQYYHSDVDGYNLASGGDSNAMDSPKVREIHDKKMRSDEVRHKISESMKRRISEQGRKDEYVQRLRKGYQDYLYSDKFYEDRKKQHLSPEHFKALNDAKNKAVYCIDIEDSVVAEFERVKDGAEWWYNNGYSDVAEIRYLSTVIKRSNDKNIYIRGLKWIYRV